ncbi:MAG TPA: SDR family oxidoreductase [Campylobacterales bacterium]|nr:SDR family oxidoreductase [Campylobacterales bacterium]
MSYVLIVGAKSDIAKAVAREYAKNGYNIYLAGRGVEELESFATDLTVRSNCKVERLELDILDYSGHQAFYDALAEKPLGVVVAVGYLGKQEKAQKDFDEAQKIMDSNYTGVVSFLNVIANDFESRRSGFIVGISSVAGDRGRKSNYIYGSAKAAFSAYLSGLRNRMYDAQVDVLTVKPGFVATAMTEGMDLPEKLTAQPNEVAEDIYKAQQKKKNIIYTKSLWRVIMFIITSIPEWQFKKMSI